MKRKTVRALFDQPETLRHEDVAASAILKQLLKVHIPNSIEDAIVGGKIYASVFEINETEHYVEIHKNHWIQALETCLLWYIDDENYEMCNHIKNMIKSIQGKPKKVSTKKNKDGKGF